jgi:MOSC domain-containing protein YiiM
MEKNRQQARVLAVNVSGARGTKKGEVERGFLKENLGLEGDAHAERGSHRQVSLLGAESIKKMELKGLNAVPGIFAENIITEGIDLVHLEPGMRISVGKTAVLEITQIGKECHTGCEISALVGECIMPTEGVFARVVKGGTIKKGDPITPL